MPFTINFKNNDEIKVFSEDAITGNNADYISQTQQHEMQKSYEGVPIFVDTVMESLRTGKPFEECEKPESGMGWLNGKFGYISPIYEFKGWDIH